MFATKEDKFSTLGHLLIACRETGIEKKVASQLYAEFLNSVAKHSKKEADDRGHDWYLGLEFSEKEYIYCQHCDEPMKVVNEFFEDKHGVCVHVECEICQNEFVQFGLENQRG